MKGLHLGKPILLEGPPGVGKTSSIEQLAKAIGKQLIRVNLSEQTDMIDLLGSEFPIESSD
ncbi:MAG: AAA family ATPase [Streptococcus sp.]|jgi:midasin|nr:AAA family ATPase [Streptococcus sp.]